MKMRYVCQNCRNSYESRKENSKFCSKECQKSYYEVSYNCDYCGRPFKVKRSKLLQLENGERKNIFCSKECHNKSQIKIHPVQKCRNCGIEFSVYPSQQNQIFCSKDCFEEYRSKNAMINTPRICKYCGKEFYSENKNQIFCSIECSNKSQQKRVIVECDYCHKKIERKDYQIQQNQHHFCSIECRMKWQKWSVEDNDILIKYYGSIPNKEIQEKLSKKYNEKAIKSQAGRLGLYDHDRWWTDNETKILLDNYEHIPFNELRNLLPNRSRFSILGKAHSFGLKTYTYTIRRYTNEEDSFLKMNYLSMSNNKLASILGRTETAISIRLYILGLYRPNEIHNYKTIYNYVRARLSAWKQKVREDNNYICSVTLKDCEHNAVIHHIRSFNLLMIQALEDLDFTLKKSIDDYTQNELDDFLEYFLFLQEYYGEYCCVCSEVHNLFHKLYGCGNNTAEQWYEFVENYRNNKYIDIS